MLEKLLKKLGIDTVHLSKVVLSSDVEDGAVFFNGMYKGYQLTVEYKGGSKFALDAFIPNEESVPSISFYLFDGLVYIQESYSQELNASYDFFNQLTQGE